MSARRRRKRARVEPTHEWERLVPLFEWPEQENYEVILPHVLSHVGVKVWIFRQSYSTHR
jgi:hypothetical protein